MPMAGSDHEASPLRDLERERKGRVVMMNGYPTTIGSFTHEAALDGCERTVFRNDRAVDATRCHVALAFAKGFGRGQTVTPTHYALFRNLFTGFGFCRPKREFEELVGARYETVLGNRLHTVFDVTQLPPATPSPGSNT